MDSDNDFEEENDELDIDESEIEIKHKKYSYKHNEINIQGFPLKPPVSKNIPNNQVKIKNVKYGQIRKDGCVSMFPCETYCRCDRWT